MIAASIMARARFIGFLVVALPAVRLGLLLFRILVVIVMVAVLGWHSYLLVYCCIQHRLQERDYPAIAVR